MVKTNSKQRERLARIDAVKSAIATMIGENELVEIDYKKLLMELMSSLLVSERIAKEYIKIAKYQLGE